MKPSESGKHFITEDENKTKIKKTLNNIGAIITFILLLWLIISMSIFRLRHAWATETEILINLPKVLIFKKISYEETRPKGEIK